MTGTLGIEVAPTALAQIQSQRHAERSVASEGIPEGSACALVEGVRGDAASNVTAGDLLGSFGSSR
jgi:hypothetical protein